MLWECVLPSSRPSLFSVLALSLSIAGCKSDTPAFRAACEAGDAHACEVVAARLVLGTEGQANQDEIAKLHKRAYDLYVKACAAGDKDACGKMTVCGLVTAPLPLDLPKVGGGEIQLILSVELRADGTTLTDGKPVADDASLLATAKEAILKSPDLRAVIRADSTVPHGRVVRVLDLLKQAGISKIAFGTRG